METSTALNTSTSLKTSLSERILTQFHLPASDLAACDKYYILHWEARFLFTQLLKSPRIVRENKAYQPIFLDGITESYLSTNPEDQVRLSFRKLRGHETGIVLIKKSPVATLFSQD